MTETSRSRRTLPKKYLPRLSGKRVLITGSSRGIGRETARILLSAGATVILNGRSPERLTESRRRLAEEFPDASLSAFPADVADPHAADELARHIRETWGSLDILINNAGLSMRGGIRELSADTITTMVSANLHSALQITRSCLPLLTGSGGHVTFISTVGALHGFPNIFSLFPQRKPRWNVLRNHLTRNTRPREWTAGVVYLGFVENDPDKEILTADGRLFHHSRKAMQSQDVAAVKIIEASVSRKKRAITVWKGVVLDLFHRLSPGLTTTVLNRGGKTIHDVESADEDGKRG